MRSRIVFALAAAFALALAGPALATNGYFAPSFGTPYVAMGGAGVALPLNTIAPATNPAANAFITGYDLSLAVFNPNREFTVTGNPSGFPGTFGLQPGTVKSDTSIFLMPNIGANWKLNDRMTLGVAIYGNGGMNTTYPVSVFYAGRTGIDLSQMFIAPTATYKVTPDHAFGLSAIICMQRFQAEGLGSFAPFSSDPSHLSNNGHQATFGVGGRIGYLGKLTPWLSVGASYQTEIEMGRFSEYAGLFAEQGDFDIPQNWTVGFAVKPADSFTVAFDVQEIYYSRTESVGNPMLPNLMTAHLGDDGGAGFGWQNVTAYKVGLQYVASPAWTLRAGYSHCTQPVRASEVLFNILAPGVVQDHITAGVSAKAGKSSTVHFSVLHALSQSVSGPNSLEVPGRQTIELKMNQWVFDLGLSFGF